MEALFACTKCNSRHPFEELSQGQQLCKECRGAYPIVKCTYCRTEFQQENSKGNTSTICKKCEQNVKSFGKPSACEYCNIIAAFIGSKCQRCTNSEKRYGPPLNCEQCKQRCAFDRQDDSRKKVDGKLLCWLCTLSYKRALAKAKQNDPLRHTSFSLHKSSGNGGHHRSSSGHKNKLHHNKVQLKHHSSSASGNNSNNNNNNNSKKPRLDSNNKTTTNGSMPSSSSSMESAAPDLVSSDHMIAVTQLREQMAVLQKQVQAKDQLMLAKDKLTTELKAQKLSSEKELRTKITNLQKQHKDQVEALQTKLKAMQKKVATLSKGKRFDSPLS